MYWTDNEHEPKKINLTRSRKGTGANTRTSTSLSVGAHPNFHTRLVVDSLDNPGQQTIVLNDAGNEPIWVKWDNVTVLKPSPKRALKIEMSATAVRRETNVGEELNTFGVIPNKKIHTGLYGPDADAYITDVVFESPVAFREGDVVNFNIVNGGPGGEEAVTALVYESPYNTLNDAEGTTGVKFQVLTLSLIHISEPTRPY